jgi:hypothetical protein
LHYAAKYGYLSKAKKLIKKGIDINAKNNSGETVLHYAVEYGSISLTNKLIAKGIDINAKDNSGDTALHYAAKYDNSSLTNRLIAEGIDINAKNNSGDTALHYAARYGNLLKGSNIAKNNSGQTALDLDRYQELYNLFGPRVLGLSSDSLIDDVDKSGPPPPTGLPGKGPAQWYQCNPDIKYEDGHPCYNKGGRRKRKSRKRKTRHKTRRKRKTKRKTRRKRNNRKKRTTIQTTSHFHN